MVHHHMVWAASAVDTNPTCHPTSKDLPETLREGRLDGLDLPLEEAHLPIEAHQDDL